MASFLGFTLAVSIPLSPFETTKFTKPRNQAAKICCIGWVIISIFSCAHTTYLTCCPNGLIMKFRLVWEGRIRMAFWDLPNLVTSLGWSSRDALTGTRMPEKPLNAKSAKRKTAVYLFGRWVFPQFKVIVYFLRKFLFGIFLN